MIAVSAYSFNVRPRDAEARREPVVNLFATVLTYPAPSANYRGESEENRSVIQKITYGRFEYPDHLARVDAQRPPRDPRRLRPAGNRQPPRTTRSSSPSSSRTIPTPTSMPTTSSSATWSPPAGPTQEDPREGQGGGAGREGVPVQARLGPAHEPGRGVEPYRNNAVFTQSPLTSEDSPWQNAKTSALLHRETALTAFQYPFALNLDDCKAKPDWTKALLKAIGELNDVAGNHARSYFEMAPASIVAPAHRPARRRLRHLRLQRRRATIPRSSTASSTRTATTRGDEFFLGGKIVKDMRRRSGRGAEGARASPSTATRAGCWRPSARRLPGEGGVTMLCLASRPRSPPSGPSPPAGIGRRPAFLTPSAAYGLALNLAGIETRRDDGLSAMTVTRFDLPPARIALGADAGPSRSRRSRPSSSSSTTIRSGPRARDARRTPRATSTTSRPSAASSSPTSAPSSRLDFADRPRSRT